MPTGAASGTARLARLDGLYALVKAPEEARAAIAGGARVVQVRVKDAPAGEALDVARRTVAIARGRALVIVNDRADLALLSGADGVHLGDEDLPVADARTLLGPDLLVGRTARTLDEARAAIAAGADHVGFGPIFPSRTKPLAVAPRGLEALRQVVAGLGAPVVAISGIDASNIADVARTGAACAAVVDAIFGAGIPEENARRLAAAFEEGRLPARSGVGFRRGRGSAMTSRPRIGVTLDADEGRSRYELKTSYVEAVLAAGGLPILLPHANEAAGAYLALLEGLVVTGGAFDVPPELYGEVRTKACGPTKPERTAFEKDLLEAAIASRLPVLGVCGGMQLLNVVRGGTLYQDLASAGLPSHEQPAHLGHDLLVVPGTHLAALLGTGTLAANSTHHQAVRDPGAGVLVSARAPDGIVEAIELPDLPYAIGVQWHPETALLRDARHAALYRGLVEAARDARR